MWRVFMLLSALGMLMWWGVRPEPTGVGGGSIGFYNQAAPGLAPELEGAVEASLRAAAEGAVEGLEAARPEAEVSEDAQASEEAQASEDAQASEPESEPASKPEAAPTCYEEDPIALAPTGTDLALASGWVRRDSTWVQVLPPVTALVWAEDGLWATEQTPDAVHLWHAGFTDPPRRVLTWPTTDSVIALAHHRGRTALLVGRDLLVWSRAEVRASSAFGGSPLGTRELRSGCEAERAGQGASFRSRKTRQPTGFTPFFGCGSLRHHVLDPEVAYKVDWAAIDLTGRILRVAVGYQWSAGCGGGGEGGYHFEIQGKTVRNTLKSSVDDLPFYEVVGASGGWAYFAHNTYSEGASSDGLWAVRGTQAVRLTTDPAAVVVHGPRGRTLVAAEGALWEFEGTRRVRRLTDEPVVRTYHQPLAYNGQEVALASEQGLRLWAPSTGWQAVLPACSP